MRLPDDFPHTRREQYLLALPSNLRTAAERAACLEVAARLREYLSSSDRRIDELLAEVRRRGIPLEDPRVSSPLVDSP